MTYITPALKAAFVAVLSAALGLAIGTAVGGTLLPFPRVGGGQSLRIGVMLGGLPGAAAGFLLGVRSYRRRCHSDEAVVRHIVSLLTALTGFALGTALAAPLILSIDRAFRILGGMLYGGILLSIWGFFLGRDNCRHN